MIRGRSAALQHRRPPGRRRPELGRRECDTVTAAIPGEITAIVPAYNEAESIAETIRSLQAQTWPISQIIVVDDCSTDDTGSIAAALGVKVIRPAANTG